MNRKVYLGIDIGGTNINVGIIDNIGKIILSDKIPTKYRSNDALQNISRIIKIAKTLLNKLKTKDLQSIGIGVPGTVDAESGRVVFTPNIEWKGFYKLNLIEIFNDAFNVPVYIAQDTEAAALGEFYYGNGRNCKNLVCITVGTGIGCGIILDGKIYTGSFGTAGELGHMIVKKNGLFCGCGNRGCLETCSSGNGILRNFKRLIKNGEKTILVHKKIEQIEVKDIFEAIRWGDKVSKKVIDEALYYLGIGIGNIVNILSPQKVLLSGGICKEEELFTKPLIEKVYDNMYKYLRDKVIVESALLGDDAPMIGAAVISKYAESNKKKSARSE